MDHGVQQETYAGNAVCTFVCFLRATALSCFARLIAIVEASVRLSVRPSHSGIVST